MRPWMIVLVSGVGVIVVAAAMVAPELSGASRSDIGPILLPHLPTLAVASLAVYALGAMVLATGTLVAEVLFIRHRLERMGGYPTPAQPNWTAAFGSAGLHRLIPWPAAESARRAGTGERILLQGQFSAAAARGEIARLHYLWLARTHFCSALIVLTALVGLGLAQEHGSVPILLGGIPTISAILILVGLSLLAILSRVAFDVSAEPLIETISQLAAAPLEVMVLRRILEVLEAVRTTAAVGGGAPALTPQLPERLDAVIAEGQRSLVDAAKHLSATADALGATIGSSVDALKTAIMAATQLPTAAGHRDEAFASLELQSAVEALTAVLKRLTATPDTIEEAPLRADQAAPRPNLARELRQLLREIETAH
jgi:hypothetical protein